MWLTVGFFHTHPMLSPPNQNIIQRKLASKADADASLRRQGVEVLLTCCGACPGSVRKINGFPEVTFSISTGGCCPCTLASICILLRRASGLTY